ncbi:MAG TPA: glycosyltransferase family 2 protein [Chitinophagaceae bacterium]|nr:glycosyltransferase family 2 protein [Chitinophagaceae bacterium]
MISPAIFYILIFEKTFPFLNHQPNVAIVILNWNGKKYLEQFLPSVAASDYSNYEIIVADNCSSDDSILFLENNYPSIRIIHLAMNYGFAKGYNEALKEVSADYYVLLNSDVEVNKGWLEPMISLMEADTTLAACQPKVLSYANKDLFEYAGAAGGWIDKYGYPFAMGRIFDVCEKDHGQYDKASLIFWASGAAMFIRSSVFHEVKGFDEYFFAHQEEIDLCWRIQLAGYRLSSCPQSVVYHVGGGTLPRGNTMKTYLNFRNNQIMLAKNLPWTQKWWKIPFRVFLDSVSAIKGLFIGDAGYFLAILRAHLAFLKWILLKQGRSVFPQKRNAPLYGMYNHNLVWNHFVKKKKYFGDLIKNAF